MLDASENPVHGRGDGAAMHAATMSRVLAESELARHKAPSPVSNSLASRAKRMHARSRINDAEAVRKLPSPRQNASSMRVRMAGRAEDAMLAAPSRSSSSSSSTSTSTSYRGRSMPAADYTSPSTSTYNHWGPPADGPGWVSPRQPPHTDTVTRAAPTVATNRLSATEFVDRLRRMRSAPGDTASGA